MKKFLWILLIIGVVAVAGYFYVFHKSHRDLVSEKASQTLTANEISAQYAESQETANALYLDQVIEVSGIVETSDGKSMVLEGGIFCNAAEGAKFNSEAGIEVKIKGRVVSFDELFGEVRMDNCTVVQ